MTNTDIEEKPKRKQLPGCNRCSFTGVVDLEKQGVVYGFACKCPRGKSNTNMRDYEYALANGYTLTDNSKLNFEGYDEYMRTIVVDENTIAVNDYLPYKD